MPLIEDTPSTPPLQAPVAVRVAAPAFRGVTVDTRYVPATALLTHIEGASWTVNYYSQVLGLDNALSGQSLDRPEVFQQYKLIQKLELKVTTPLNSTQDVTNKDWNVTGQANVYPCGLIPNEGDHFITDVGDGREALFEITSSEARSIYKDTAYIVDYKLISYSDQDGRITDLNSKVVENLYYQADFLQRGQNPLISYTEHEQLETLTAFYKEILDFYFNRFFSKEYRTLLLPGQDYTIYDPFLVKAVLSMFRDDSHANIKLIRELNVSEDDNYDSPNVWTALRTKNRKLLVGGMKQTGLVASRYFSPDPVMDSARYSGVSYLVYPSDQIKSEDYLRAEMQPTDYFYLRRDPTKPLAPVYLKVSPTRLVSLFEVIQITELHGLPSYRAVSIHPTTEASYIFTSAFYTNSAGQSGLELLVQRYLSGESYDMSMLTDLSKSYTSWAPLEQFYQIPFLLALLRSAIRRM